jgi:hypothetical protein
MIAEGEINRAFDNGPILQLEKDRCFATKPAIAEIAALRSTGCRRATS